MSGEAAPERLGSSGRGAEAGPHGHPGSRHFSKASYTRLLEDRQNAAALGLRLLHQDVEHVEFRIDAEISAAAAVPFQFADRAGRRRFRIAGIGADREP